MSTSLAGIANEMPPVGTIVYNPASLPTPTYVGQQIYITNPAVPSGRSKVEWNGTIWVPPYGELIANIMGAGGAPIFNITPGVLTLTQLYAGSVIPDVMLPDGLTFQSMWEMDIYSTTGVANCISLVTLSSTTPVSIAGGGNGMHATSVTPVAGGTTAATQNVVKTHQRIGTTIKGNYGLWGITVGNNSPARSVQKGTFGTGATKIYCMAQPSSVNDNFRLFSFQIWSAGGL